MQQDLDLDSDITPNNNKKSIAIPHIIKYMGSKKPIIEFVANEIVDLHTSDSPICDLFAGSCSISAALRNQFDFISNDIQSYSAVLGNTYFSDYSFIDSGELLDQIILSAEIHTISLIRGNEHLVVDFRKINQLDDFYEIENSQRNLIHVNKWDNEFHLFTKFYSGTYWSFEQCVWIDSIRKVAEGYKESPVYFAILSSLMYAMSYTSQSTGHFAQYRDGKTEKAMTDILIYRQKAISSLFRKKFKELLSTLCVESRKIVATTSDFFTSLKALPKEATVYADPPYAAVHYSRFYHALETLVRYDYPELAFKGRYRSDRHQSRFSIKKQALPAFIDLFDGVIAKDGQLALSYSDTGVLQFDSIVAAAEKRFPSRYYSLGYKTLSHEHSSMGYDKKRTVNEYLLIAKRK